MAFTTSHNPTVQQVRPTAYTPGMSIRTLLDERSSGSQLRRPHLQRGLVHAGACLALFGTLCMAVAPAEAQWKWRDKDGRVTVSDRPPPRDIPDKDVLSKPVSESRRAAAVQAAASAASAPTTAAKPAAPTAMEREVQARKAAAEQEQAAKKKADEDKLNSQRADNCRAARGHLTALESGQRIARTNEKGEREVLDDKGRGDETRRAREIIASDCR